MGYLVNQLSVDDYNDRDKTHVDDETGYTYRQLRIDKSVLVDGYDEVHDWQGDSYRVVVENNRNRHNWDQLIVRVTKLQQAHS